MLPDIGSDFLQLGRAANDMIKRFLLPKGSGSACFTINYIGRKRLPGMYDVREFVADRGRDQHMDMICLNDELIEVVAVPVEMLEGIRHPGLQVGFAKQAIAVPLIEPFLNAPRKLV